MSVSVTPVALDVPFIIVPMRGVDTGLPYWRIDVITDDWPAEAPRGVIGFAESPSLWVDPIHDLKISIFDSVHAANFKRTPLDQQMITSKSRNRFRDKNCTHLKVVGNAYLVPDGFELRAIFSVRKDVYFVLHTYTEEDLDWMSKHQTVVDSYTRRLDEAYQDPEDELWDEFDMNELLTMKSDEMVLDAVVDVASGSVLVSQSEYRTDAYIDLTTLATSRHNVSNAGDRESVIWIDGTTACTFKKRGSNVCRLTLDMPTSEYAAADGGNVTMDIDIIVALSYDQLRTATSWAIPDFVEIEGYPDSTEAFNILQRSYITPSGNKVLLPVVVVATTVRGNAQLGWKEDSPLTPVFQFVTGYKAAVVLTHTPLLPSDSQLTYEKAAYQLRERVKRLFRKDLLEHKAKLALYDSSSGQSALNYLTQRTMENVRYLGINSLAYCRDLRKLLELKDIVSDIIHRPLNPKTWANIWFQFRYGLRLTIIDSFELRDALVKKAQSDDTRDWATARAAVQRTIEVDGIAYRCEMHQKAYFDYRSKGLPGRARTLYRYLREADLYPSLYNLWDLVPFSFVIDWFFPLDDFFESIDKNIDEIILPLDSVLYSCKLFEREKTTYQASNLSLDSKLQFYVRWVEKSLPFVQLDFPTLGWRMDWKRYTDSAFLVIQRRK